MRVKIKALVDVFLELEMTEEAANNGDSIKQAISDNLLKRGEVNIHCALVESRKETVH